MRGSGTERGRVTDGSFKAVGVADVGLMCTNDFKVSLEAASVYKEVARFAAPPCLSELLALRSRVSLAIIYIYPPFFPQSMMLSRALEVDIQSGYGKIQGRIDTEVARNQTLAAERSAFTEKEKLLEGRVAELEGQRSTMQREVESLREGCSVLEAEVAAERECSATVAQATWGAMERMEGAMTKLGAVPPSRGHTVAQLDKTLDRLYWAGEVFVPAARAYGNHCAKAAWLSALISL